MKENIKKKNKVDFLIEKILWFCSNTYFVSYHNTASSLSCFLHNVLSGTPAVSPEQRKKYVCLCLNGSTAPLCFLIHSFSVREYYH